MGLTWLGTVPLTSGLVAKVFGTRHLGTLFGVCFLSHQIGSFLGAWLGGFVFDLTGSYSLIWGATAAASLVAAMLHFPIDDKVVTGPALPDPTLAGSGAGVRLSPLCPDRAISGARRSARPSGRGSGASCSRRDGGAGRSR